MQDGILLAVEGWDTEPWAAAIRAGAPQRPLHVWPDLADPARIAYALVWQPPAGILARLPNLRAIFSLGAGVDHFIDQADLPDVPIVRLVNAHLTRRMTEWVVLQVLTHHRQQHAYARQQREHIWYERDQPAAGDVTIGIMGLGVLGSDASAALQRIGFRVAGWSRRPTRIAGIKSFHGSEGLAPFLAGTDILVCLLPLTSATRGILSMPLFRALSRRHTSHFPVLINAGRGGLQIESDIVAAIESGVLAGASLDVFEREPLDSRSRLWDLPNVIITPHAAAASTPSEAIPAILAEIAAHEAGAPFPHLVDRQSQY